MYCTQHTHFCMLIMSILFVYVLFCPLINSIPYVCKYLTINFYLFFVILLFCMFILCRLTMMVWVIGTILLTPMLNLTRTPTFSVRSLKSIWLMKSTPRLKCPISKMDDSEDSFMSSIRYKKYIFCTSSG